MNNFIANWQMQAGLTLQNKMKLTLQYTQSFTPLAKKYIEPNLHWQNLSLSVGVPLQVKKKVKK